MHLRITDVTVSPARIDELADVLSNKAIPIVSAQKGHQGLLCAADRGTGRCAIVSLWESREAVDASEPAIASIRGETLDAVAAQLNGIQLLEVLREVRVRPSQVGARTRVVRITAPTGSADDLVDFYERVAVPRLQSQDGFLNSRLVRDIEEAERFAAVSHWADAAALEASAGNSVALRDEVAKAVPGTAIGEVSTAEVIFIELAK